MNSDNKGNLEVVVSSLGLLFQETRSCKLGCYLNILVNSPGNVSPKDDFLLHVQYVVEKMELLE